MSSTVWVLIWYVQSGELHTVVTELNVDTTLGQNYLYWKEDEVAEAYRDLFNEAEVLYDDIVKVEHIGGRI